ncbi:thiamine kinase-like enzyme [Virgibacillus campisalis]|uniref:Thiamine kinase-like enzyme n=1 Tax=Virgibacillus alimentarius TaxID=698769 RepID=A0ABS4SCL6_9BACI|nr:thiamine kinase-like enzyme [Virgibacillus alimentarius]
MNWFKQVLGKEWDILPAGGLTGDAYVAEKDNQRLFLKRNSSPFLAVLSAEGIVPKLVWTKRMENGDVITAQEWLEGKKLESKDMQHLQVADLLRKIHHSSELLHMLMRLGKKPVSSEDSFKIITQRLHANCLIPMYKEVKVALHYLERLLPVTKAQKKVVCHGDLNHNNLIWTKDNRLYLVDWDNAMIADPITDFGMVLKWYIPKKDWNKWLNQYGVKKDKQLIERMYWYLILDSLHYLNWHYERHESIKVMERLHDLQYLNDYVDRVILN